MRKKIEFIILLLLIAGLVALNRNLEKQVDSEAVEVKENMVILDAGHGGKDPGKVGIGNVMEKHLNLVIAEKVEKKLKKENIQVILTRTEDKMLSEDGKTESQVEDLKTRVKLINEQAPALTVSIHQNSYTDPSVHGAQVFYYSTSKESREAARIMQEALLQADPDNQRQEKGNDTYYLLRRTKVPVIIVECGFLSNPKEAKQLTQEEYQDKFADAVCKGIREYIEK